MKKYVAKTKEQKERELKELQEKINQGVSEFFTSEKYIQYLKFACKFHKYSMNNIFSILIQYPKATQVASFQTWKELKRYVKKGEKGIKILVPVEYTYFYNKDNEFTLLSNATEEEKEDINAGIIKTYKKLTFKIGNVFDISQTEGEPVPKLASELIGETEEAKTIFEALKNIIEIPVSFEDTGSSKGYYHTEEKRIALNINNSINQNAKTLVHEYTHSILHQDIKTIDRETAEVQAESVAFMVCNYFNFDTSDYSFGYIGAWSSTKELKELKESADIIIKTANEIIEKIEKNLIEKKAA